MARKIFLSVLGTGFYEKCKYKKDDFLSSETRFIQQAMLEYHDVKSWTEDCVVCILLTNKAKEANWIVRGNERCKLPEKIVMNHTKDFMMSSQIWVCRFM